MFRSNRLSGLTQFGEKKKAKDPDYEEIGPQRNRKEDARPTNICELCGSEEAALRCEKCNNQAFCFSCDDMYHKHPRRATHIRKALDSNVRGAKTGVRPPLPPKATDGQLATPPQPPPRRNKSRPMFLPTNKKEQEVKNFRASSAELNLWKKSTNSTEPKGIMGSLRRIMGNRPLPPTPDQEKDEEELTAPYGGSISRSKTAPNPLNRDNNTLTVAIPQSIIEINRNSTNQPAPSSMPQTPISAHSQYPKLQPKTQSPRNRKLSLQQPPTLEDKKASVMEAPQNSWDKGPQAPIGQKGRSQSISNEQWNQVMAMNAGTQHVGPMDHFNMRTSTSDLAPKQSLSTMSNVGRAPPQPPRSGMVSSASVCDLNTMANQQQIAPYHPNMPASANSFQQLSMMGYDNQMMWGVPAPCAHCQPPPMYPNSLSHGGGMKRATSNISMNMSAAGSDITGYWSHHNAHMHPPVPMFPTGYFPQGGCHQHMLPHMAMRGSAMSIPDSMRSFNRMPSSPAPSTRSASHRSHKSSKSRASEGRKSRNHSRRRSEPESDDSASSSFSDREVPVPVVTSSLAKGRTGLAWQCDHCTFINPGHVRTCGMCSKRPPGERSSGHRDSDRRRNGRHRKTDQEDNASDYDNNKRNGRESRNDNKLRSTGSLRSSKSRNKSRRRGSYSPSVSGSNEDEGAQIERQLKDLRITGRSKDYEGVSRSTKDHGSLKREGGGSRYRNRRRFQSERSRTPARSTRSSPARKSRRTSFDSDEKIFLKLSDSSSEHLALEQKSLEGTLVGTDSKTIKGSQGLLSDDKKDSDSLELSDVDNVSDHKKQEEENPIVSEEDVPEDVFRQVFEEMKSEKIENVEVVQKMDEFEEPKYEDHKDLKECETEEPSFANTLDGIETLRTNEVAEMDPNSQVIDDRPSSTDVEMQELDVIPVLKYIEPKESDEKTTKQQNNSDYSNTKDKYSTIKKKKEPKPEISKQDHQEPEYEDVEKQQIEIEETEIYQPVYFKVPPQSDRPEEPNLNLKETENVLESSSNSSVASSARHSPDPRLTPLSYSSSDALFYSPPDSPELSDKHRRKTSSQTDRPIDDDLVTALETIDTSRDDLLKSSRETIRSSFDQIPSSDEAFEYDESNVKDRPSSVTAPVSPSTPDEGTTGYDTLTFEDAVSHPNSSTLKRSVSDQMLSSRSDNFPTLKKKETKVVLNAPLQKEVRKPPVVPRKEEEDESQLTVKEIIARRKQKAMKEQGLELVQILREAEKLGYNPEDVSVALSLSKDMGPIEWLQENWGHMIDTVSTLSSNYGRERKTNFGEITAAEAKQALRLHKGIIWDAVTACVEHRQKNFDELYSKGIFKRQDIIKALQTHEGDAEEAAIELEKPLRQKDSFFKKIWAPAEGAMQSVSSLFRRGSKTNLSEVELSKEIVSLPEASKQTEVEQSHKDLDEDDYEDRSAAHDDDSENESSFEESPGTISETEEEEPVQEEVPSDFEYKDDFKTATDLQPEPDYLSEGREEDEPINRIQPDVGGHRLNIIDMKDERFNATYEPSMTSTHTYDSVQVMKTESNSISSDKSPPKSGSSSSSQESKSNNKSSSSMKEKTKIIDNKKTEEKPKNKAKSVTSKNNGKQKEEATASVSPKKEDKRSGSSEEDNQESTLEESDEESVSVTTGRMSLSVTQTGHKKTKLDVKSQTIITDVVPLNETSSVIEEEEESEVICSDNEEEEEEKEEAIDNLPTESPLVDVTGQDQLPPDEAAKVRASGGPVTVQKASAIVGKAIANAMKRECSVKRDAYFSDSSSPPLSPTPPMSPTPPASPESEEPPEGASSIITSESEDDLLGSLDTIPEEEEISDRTESTRQRSSKAESSKSLPPAVASFSGPIFIPTDQSTASASSHSYYNVPKDGATKTKTSLPATNLSDYESLAKTNSSIKDSSKTSNKGMKTKKNQPTSTSLNSKTENKVTSPKAKEISVKAKPVAAKPYLSNKKSIFETVPKNNMEPINKPITKPLATTPASSSLTPAVGSNNPNKTETAPIITKTNHPIIQNEVPSKAIMQKEVPSQAIIQKEVPSKAIIQQATPSGSQSPAGIQRKKLQIGSRSTFDSSGESEEEEKISAAVQRVEELQKSEDPDYQDVQELKEQIQMMRRELEVQIETKDSDSDTTGQSTPSEEPMVGPVLVLSAPEEDEEPQKKTKMDDKQYEQLKFDRTVRRLLAEGQATSYEKAELAAQLLTFSFDESDSIQAAEGCSSMYTALQFLQQECELCAGKYPMAKMISMLHCTHRCCTECANNYFSFQIKTKNIRELRCPFCSEPDLDNSEETAAEYLNNLDILLKNIVDQDSHELFQRKLRDWTLMKDPNFKWCSKCSSGFIANPRARILHCPDCKDVTCAHCRKQWEPQHEGISCDDFSKWKEENDPETQAEGIAKHLAENGITCPKCRFTYSLAKGGCMHFTCGECKFEFCSGCKKPFKQGAKCPVGPYCERLGLHAHHPRNCLFYLRDKEPGQLQQLLKDNEILFETERAENSGRNVCKVMEQKETMEGLIDDACGRTTLTGHAGYCRLHYIEYLVDIINARGLDPVGIFDEADLRVCLRRNGKAVPVRRWESEKLYRDKLIKLIKEQLPLTIAQENV